MHLTMPKQVHFHNNTSTTANTAIEQKLRKYIEACNEEYYPESLFDDLYDENFVAIDAGKRVTRDDEKTIHAVLHHQRAKVELRRFHQVEPNQYDLQLAFVKEDETFVVSKIVTVENDKITNAFDYNVKSIPTTTRGPKIVPHQYANKTKINRIGTNNQIPLDFTPM
jgi:hypothetical protein